MPEEEEATLSKAIMCVALRLGSVLSLPPSPLHQLGWSGGVVVEQWCGGVEEVGGGGTTYFASVLQTRFGMAWQRSGMTALESLVETPLAMFADIEMKIPTILSFGQFGIQICSWTHR